MDYPQHDPLTRFQLAISSMRGSLHSQKRWEVIRALELGLELHTGLRADGVTPEFSHPLEMTHFMTTIERLIPSDPERALIDGLLHDTGEDKRTGFPLIEKTFRPEILADCRLLAKFDASNPEMPKKDLDSYYLGLLDSPFALFTKGVDVMHNLGTMPGAFSPKKQREQLAEKRDRILVVLKKGRKRYPEWKDAFQLLKHIINVEASMLTYALAGQD